MSRIFGRCLPDGTLRLPDWAGAVLLVRLCEKLARECFLPRSMAEEAHGKARALSSSAGKPSNSRQEDDPRPFDGIDAEKIKEGPGAG